MRNDRRSTSRGLSLGSRLEKSQAQAVGRPSRQSRLHTAFQACGYPASAFQACGYPASAWLGLRLQAGPFTSLVETKIERNERHH